jgi:hypothetical protein
MILLQDIIQLSRMTFGCMSRLHYKSLFLQEKLHILRIRRPKVTSRDTETKTAVFECELGNYMYVSEKSISLAFIQVPYEPIACTEQKLWSHIVEAACQKCSLIIFTPLHCRNCMTQWSELLQEHYFLCSPQGHQLPLKSEKNGFLDSDDVTWKMTRFGNVEFISLIWVMWILTSEPCFEYKHLMCLFLI